MKKWYQNKNQQQPPPSPPLKKIKEKKKIKNNGVVLVPIENEYWIIFKQNCNTKKRQLPPQHLYCKIDKQFDLKKNVQEKGKPQQWILKSYSI